MADQPPLPDITALAAAIRNGTLDSDLADLVDAINDRRAKTEVDQTRQALQRLTVGDRVRLDHHVRPKYLQGAPGTIHHLDHTTVVVKLDTPVGKFTDGHINCSPRALHPITDT